MNKTYYSTTFRSDELFHYGVLGMKWGQHRAAKRGGTYTYKSWGTKRNEFKSGVVANKLAKPHGERRTNRLRIMKAKYDRRAAISRDLDKREQDYSKPGSALGVIGGRLAVSALTNGAISYKSKNHQMATAMISRHANKSVSELNGKDKLKAIVAGSAFSLTIGGRGAKAIYIREGERKYINDRFGTRKERKEIRNLAKEVSKAERKEAKSERALDKISKHTSDLDNNPHYSDRKREKLAYKHNKQVNQYMNDMSNRLAAQRAYQAKSEELKRRRSK